MSVCSSQGPGSLRCGWTLQGGNTRQGGNCLSGVAERPDLGHNWVSLRIPWTQSLAKVGQERLGDPGLLASGHVGAAAAPIHCRTVLRLSPVLRILAQPEAGSLQIVKRRRTLTPDRRPILTPLGRAEMRAAARRSWSGLRSRAAAGWVRLGS